MCNCRATRVQPKCDQRLTAGQRPGTVPLSLYLSPPSYEATHRFHSRRGIVRTRRPVRFPACRRGLFGPVVQVHEFGGWRSQRGRRRGRCHAGEVRLLQGSRRVQLNEEAPELDRGFFVIRPSMSTYLRCARIARTLGAMKYLTVVEYAKLKDVTRQAILDRIRRGTLPLADVKVKAKRIPVEDADYEQMCRNALARSKGQA